MNSLADMAVEVLTTADGRAKTALSRAHAARWFAARAAGTPIPLRGATFVRSLIQLGIGGFSFYWDRVNLTDTRRTYVPGFEIPAFGSNFGVRWEFLN